MVSIPRNVLRIAVRLSDAREGTVRRCRSFCPRVCLCVCTCSFSWNEEGGREKFCCSFFWRFLPLDAAGVLKQWGGKKKEEKKNRVLLIFLFPRIFDGIVSFIVACPLSVC